MLWSKIAAAAVMQLALSWFLGIALIPLLRKYKTGRYEPYVGDRFRTDGSEPAFGGAFAWIVFAFGAAVAAVFCENRAALYAAVIFTAAVTSAGIADDVMTDVQGRPCGVKTRTKLGFVYSASFVFLIIIKHMGLTGTAVLLPFGLGIFDMGAAFCPVTAAVMSAVIYCFRILNRFGTDEESCIGGLVQTIGFVGMLGLSVIGSAAKKDELTAFGLVGASAAMGLLLWGLSPSKLRSGSSGGFFFGALTAAAIGLADIYRLTVLLTALAAVIDAVCSAMQYAVYHSKKKLLLRGSSLHKHLSMFKMSDYKVIAVFAVIAFIGTAAGIALTIYGQNKYF